MSSASKLGTSKVFFWCLFGAGFLAVAGMLLFHQAPATMPPGVSAPTTTDVTMLAATATTIRDRLNLMGNWSIGLAAVVGLALKSGFGASWWYKITRGLLTVIFTGYFSRIILSIYDIYGVISYELDCGILRWTYIDGLVTDTALYLFICSVCSAALLITKLYETPP